MPYTVKKTFEQVAAAGAHVIAQVKANQPTLHQRIAELCQRTAPLDQTRTADQKRRSRDEIRVVEVFAPGTSLADTEWADHVAAVVRVSRDTLKRVTTTGLWEGTSEIAYFIATIALPATACAHAIRGHWGIENRLHYVRDVSFREDDSRIRCNPGIFARLRSFAANILRFNNVHNMSNGRYRIAVGGVDAMLSLRAMERALNSPAAEGEEGLKKNLAKLEDMRNRVGDDFWLMYDCWMSLDLNYATRLAQKAHQYGLKWIEEALSPDDYWGYAELRRNVPRGMLVTTGEHEATRWGFRLLLEMGCCDIIQPDVNWCGGVTELIKISALADAHGVLMVPHGSSVYSYHFVITRHNSPFTEIIMTAPKADKVLPAFTPLLLDEPVPVNGRMKASVLDKPGFGVSLNPDTQLHRPYQR